MQVFRTYFKIMKKHMLSLFLYGIMFIAITLLVTFQIFRDDNKEFAVSKVPILLINNDGDNEFVEAFITYLEGYVKYIDAEIVMAERMHYSIMMYTILTIPKGFTDEFLSGKEIVLTKEIQPIR